MDEGLAASIEVGILVTAIHQWPEAHALRGYLAHPHMHDFRISVGVKVDHADREIEFHDLRDSLRAVIYQLLSGEPLSFGNRSCESIAIDVLKALPLLMWVRVMEDDFNGATVTRT